MEEGYEVGMGEGRIKKGIENKRRGLRMRGGENIKQLKVDGCEGGVD
jgi:hypothetical protein